MIRMQDVSKSYGNVIAVDKISLNIHDGQITGLLGPNGAGKTTTLRMMTSYLSSDTGQILIGNHDVRIDPLSVKKMIGYLPESAPLYGDIIVYDYLRYVTQIRGISNFEKIDEIAAICGITEVMHKYIYELSKGYKQRVGLAGAMIHDPSILILDEPTSGLDPNQIIEIRNLIRELGKKKTVILSTHILPEVEATCDRVIIIDKGKIVADDTTDNLKSGLTGQQTISLTVACENFSLLIAKLKNINGVSDVEEIRNSDFTSVRIIANGAIEVRPEIFKMSVDNNWVIYELTREQNTLENIFRQLTAGGENVH